VDAGGQSKLFERLSEKKLPALEEETVLAWAVQMRRLDSPMIFNLGGWGLAAEELPEVDLGGPGPRHTPAAETTRDARTGRR